MHVLFFDNTLMQKEVPVRIIIEVTAQSPAGDQLAYAGEVTITRVGGLPAYRTFTYQLTHPGGAKQELTICKNGAAIAHIHGPLHVENQQADQDLLELPVEVQYLVALIASGVITTITDILAERAALGPIRETVLQENWMELLANPIPVMLAAQHKYELDIDDPVRQSLVCALCQ